MPSCLILRPDWVLLNLGIAVMGAVPAVKLETMVRSRLFVGDARACVICLVTVVGVVVAS